MKIGLYEMDSNRADAGATYVGEFELDSCFDGNDDPDRAQVEAELIENGHTWYGGGASPEFYLIRRKP